MALLGWHVSRHKIDRRQMSNAEQKGAVDLLGDPKSELIDLSPQLRNQRLLEPLNQLYGARNSHQGEDGGSLFEGLDTHYLCMATLNYMMEGSAVGAGYSMSDVRSYLVSLIGRIRPDKSGADCSKAADVVIGCLSNKSENYKEFEFSYFHAPTLEFRLYRFRLVSLEPDLDDVYRYCPTPEGYLLLLGMLDVDVEDQQILMEKMLQILIERGRFEQAAEFARRAMVLSIEHRQHINGHILQAIRAPGTVKWSSDIKPRLDDSRQHVKGRQEEEGRLLMVVRNKMGEVENVKSKLELSSLHDLLSKAGNVRARLLLEVTTAEGRFIEAQTAAFRARKSSGLPDLEAQLLPEVLSRPGLHLDVVAEDLIVSLFPATFPKAPDLSNLLSILLERRQLPNDVDDEEDGDELEPFEEWPDPFPEQLVVKISKWLFTKFAENRSWRIDELIEAGAKEGFSGIEQQCIAFCLYRSFPDSESEFKTHHAVIDGEYETWVVKGDNLRFDIKTND